MHGDIAPGTILTSDSLEQKYGVSRTVIREALKVLHDKGVKIVILSSTEFGSDDQLVCLASHMNNGQITKARIVFPGLPSHFVGTGDLFTGERLCDF